MKSKSAGIVPGRASAARLRQLAWRCREVSELTAVPELTSEMISIADALEREAKLVEPNLA